MTSGTEVDEAERHYASAEEAFLSAVRASYDRAALAALADEVAATATAWNAKAYDAYHASRGEYRESLDLLTERTEVLESLWFDIAGAFHGRVAHRDG